MSDNLSPISIIGAGVIAIEYAKVLSSLNVPFRVITRGTDKAEIIKAQFRDIQVSTGGHMAHLDLIKTSSACIIAAPTIQLASITKDVIESGVQRILVEKPLALNTQEVQLIEQALKGRLSTRIFIAYNRRNYVSVKAAADIIRQDGGVSSAHFDFTEALFRIPASYSHETLSTWGLANSTHVIDTVFHLIGKPKTLSCQHFEQDKIEWHRHAAVFIGNGVSEQGVPFSYHSNWISAGRWNIEILTQKRKLMFSPMETLREQALGSFQIAEVVLDYEDEKVFKPGFLSQCKAFVSQKDIALLEFSEFRLLFPFYQGILGYKG